MNVVWEAIRDRREVAVDFLASQDSEKRFECYIDALADVIGHADRRAPLQAYCEGLLLPGERKSVEPMAAVTAPARVAAQHQSLLHFVGQGPWSDEAILAKVRDLVLPAVERHGPIEAWIIDDTGFPKKGKHSVGVARQYCGQLGKRENCQVAVSLSIANHGASLPVAYRLYLSEDWAADAVGRHKVGVPASITFRTKPEIALRQVKDALAAGIPPGVVLMDAGYGSDTDLRTGLAALGLSYSGGIMPNTSVWPAGAGPLPPKTWSGRGRRPSRLRRDAEHQPVEVRALAQTLPEDAWQTITWRDGTALPLTSRFARLRVRAAHRDYQLSESRPEEWLLIEWPEGEDEPTKYWFSNLPEAIAFERLVDLTKLRWRIERDYQELKQEVGLGHYEGRGWRGFHHHATLCIAAYGFLISERETIPPSGYRAATRRSQPAVPDGSRSRGSAHSPRATLSQLNSNHAPETDRGAGPQNAAVPVLCQTDCIGAPPYFMTQ
jgi:SRSO17 transposase